MTGLKTPALAAALLLLAVSAPATVAHAADIYNQGGSIKDAPGTFYSGPERNHTGWSARAFIGYAWGDRDIKQTYNDDFVSNCTLVDPLDTEGADKLAQRALDLQADGIDATFDGKTLITPIAAVFSAVTGQDDFASFVGGGEVEYLFQRGQWGLGLALGATFYGNNESKLSYDDGNVRFKGGTQLVPHGSPLEGEPTGFTTSGFASVERLFDIDPTLKLYYFPGADTGLYFKAGPSVARAKIKAGAVENGFPASAVAYEKDDTSIGVVLGIGMVHWINPNLSLSIDGDWKKHSFSASGSKTIDIEAKDRCCDGDFSEQVNLRSNTDVDDSVWAIKTGLAYHF